MVNFGRHGLDVVQGCQYLVLLNMLAVSLDMTCMHTRMIQLKGNAMVPNPGKTFIKLNSIAYCAEAKQVADENSEGTWLLL